MYREVQGVPYLFQMNLESSSKINHPIGTLGDHLKDVFLFSLYKVNNFGMPNQNITS